MVNYQLGKIYKIVDLDSNKCYVGSTCEPTLARRLANHVSDELIFSCVCIYRIVFLLHLLTCHFAALLLNVVGDGPHHTYFHAGVNINKSFVSNNVK